MSLSHKHTSFVLYATTESFELCADTLYTGLGKTKCRLHHFKLICLGSIDALNRWGDIAVFIGHGLQAFPFKCMLQGEASSARCTKRERKVRGGSLASRRVPLSSPAGQWLSDYLASGRKSAIGRLPRGTSINEESLRNALAFVTLQHRSYTVAGTVRRVGRRQIGDPNVIHLLRGAVCSA